MLTALVNRPVLTLMLVLAVCVLGLWSMAHIPIELVPRADYPALGVTAYWPGAPPLAVQTRVTSLIEGAARSLKGIHKTSTRSSTGSGQIDIELIPGTNLDFAELELKEKLKRLADELPAYVRPDVQRRQPRQFEVHPFFRCVLVSQEPLPVLHRLYRRHLQHRLEALEGIRRVAATGGGDPELQVILDPRALAGLEVTPNDIQTRITDAVGIPSGALIDEGPRRVVLRLSPEVIRPADLAKLDVARRDKRPVTLGEVGRIRLTRSEAPRVSRYNGHNLMRISLEKEPGADTLELAERVKTVFREGLTHFPAGTSIRVLDDESFEITRQLRRLELLAAVIVAGLLVAIFLMLGTLRHALLVLSVLVVSILGTFTLIYLLDIPLNLLTLSGLALSFGMLVDNAVIVLDSILQHLAAGEPPRQAAANGVSRVAWAALGATLTTVTVFMAFPFFQDKLRIYYLPLAQVVTLSLTVSLVAAVVVLPPLVIRFAPQAPVHRPALHRGLIPVLRWSCRHPALIFLLAGGLLAGSLHLFYDRVSIGHFFNWQPRQELRVNVTMPPGSEIERTAALLTAFEEDALAAPGKKSVLVEYGTEGGSLRVTFPPEVEASFLPLELRSKLVSRATQYAGTSIMISGFDPQSYFSSSTPMNSGNVQLKLRGYSLSRLLELGETIRRGVLRNRRIREVNLKTTEYYSGEMEKVVFITPRRDELGRRGIRWSEVADRIAQLAPRPGGQRTFRLGPEEYVFQLRSGHGGIPDLAGLRRTEIGLADGRRFRLPELVQIRLDTVSSAIDREDQAYVLLVAWDYLGSARAGQRFRDAVAANLYLPPGFELDTFNPVFMTREETRSVIGALALALGVIFLILAALYESPLRALLVFLVYPLGLIGALAGFVVFGMGFDSSAYIGLILASGIVVNIGILLMSHMELRVRETGRLFEGLVAGVAERFRAVGITTLTTLVGLFPFVIFQTNQRGDIWSSLALATFGGLISATLLVPLVLPVAYYGLMRRRTTRTPSPGWNDTTVPAAEPES